MVYFFTMEKKTIKKLKLFSTILGCFASDRVSVDGMLVAQNENGSIGLVNEKCVDFPKKAG